MDEWPNESTLARHFAMLEVIVIYGPGHVQTIQGNLIPSLADQSHRTPIRVNLFNYRERSAHFHESKDDSVWVRDVSERSTRSGKLGFGEAVNEAFHAIEPDSWVLIVNPDTRLERYAIEHLVRTATLGEQPIGIVEARQWPTEHPKEYDLATGETPWASGACMLINAGLFREIGGFDPAFFMYCEDVDFSWRVWIAGYKVIYEPRALCYHYTGLHSYRTDRWYLEHYYCARNFLLIAYKFLGRVGERQACELFDAQCMPASLKAQILRDYSRIKPSISRVQESNPRIVIKGYNCFHELRRIA